MAVSMIKMFRRNRKALLAGLTIVTMLAFVFVPAFIEILSSRGGRDATVVTTRFGKLKQSQLQSLVQDQQRLAEFFEGVSAKLLEKKDYMRADGTRRLAMMLASQGNVEEATVHMWLLGERAKELGIRVSKKAADDFLLEVSGGKLNAADYREILGRSGQHAISQPQFFAMIQRQLVVMRISELFGPGFRATTPAQNYEYFLQLNRKAQIEAIAVPVVQWTGKVANPSDAELENFYEEYKNVAYSPNSVAPGLLQPHRVNVRYMKADFAKFRDTKLVPEERIREHYEQNKDILYRESEIKPQGTPDATPATTPAATPAAKPDAKPEAKPAAKSEAKPEAKPAAKPEVKPEAKPAPKPEAKPEVKPETTPAAKPAEKKEPSKTSATRPSAKIRLVADEKPAPALALAAPALAPAAAAAPPAAAPAPAKVEAPKAEAPKVGLPVAEGTSGAKSGGQLPKPPAAPPKYIPLEKVHDEIAKQLADMDAEKKIRDVLTGVQDEAAKYLAERLTQQYSDADGGVKKTTVEPDWAARAKERGLALSQTGVISGWDVNRLDIGGSMVERRTFAEFVFGGMRASQASISTDTQRNGYVFWKIQELPSAVELLDDAAFKARVIESWKKVQARSLAAKEAERLVAECRAARKPLKEAFASQKNLTVLSPEPFSWYSVNYLPSQGQFQSQLQLSVVTGVESAGMEFMGTVFKMKPGDAGVVWNSPQSVAYAVQLVEFSPRENTLWTEFMASQGGGQFMQLARQDVGRLEQEWSASLTKDAALKWEPGFPHGGRRGGNADDDD